jgi:hypothetical protein
MEKRKTMNHEKSLAQPQQTQIAVLLPQINLNPYTIHLTISKHPKHKSFSI